MITACGGTWHPEHFLCTSCRIGLVRQDFYERDEQPYCADCHQTMFSPKCAYCNEAILDYIEAYVLNAYIPSSTI
ncbi:unnamed protein product [Protopolystoma xenopodis]|uniref:LIM zinc-binding domain-containing protein n=1 Tax=Protopolystoma xenopodis TaxID=117903 RepID=A0A448X602_9PLAT|nr:unnamed protein product [Protopolystoma xenopodis]